MRYLKLSAISQVLNVSEISRKKNNINPYITDSLRSLIEIALRSPSSHNAQMWKINFSEPGVIELLLDKKRLVAEVDPENREAFISIGSLYESIVSVSGEYSLKPVVEKSENESVCVRIKFEHITMVENNRFSKLIRKRCTARGNFKRDEIAEKDINYLCASSPGMVEFYPKESKKGNKISDLARKAVKNQTKNDSIQQELSNWFRFSRKEARDRKDGITPEMMGFKGLKKHLLYLLFNKKTATRKSFRNRTVSITEKQIRNCGGFFLIRSESNARESLIEAGRVLQRLWLRAAECNIAFHPMSQILEEKGPKKSLYHLTGDDKEIQMIIRAGYIDNYPEPSSMRRSIDDILIS